MVTLFIPMRKILRNIASVAKTKKDKNKVDINNLIDDGQVINKESHNEKKPVKNG